MQVHFIAVRGSVMHQLAIALLKKGYTVTGSDDEVFEPAKSNLEKRASLLKTGGMLKGYTRICRKRFARV